MLKFEYKTIDYIADKWGILKIKDDLLENDLNGMGLEGWDLVEKIQINQGGSTKKILLIFKRPIFDEV